MIERTICVLGGGIGGVVAANRLKKLLGPSRKVVLIDKNPDHVFQPSFLNVLTGKRTPAQITRSLSRLRRKGIEFLQGEVTAIRPDQNLVRLEGRDLEYEYLVVALGAESNMSAVAGLSDAATNLYSLDGILAIREAIDSIAGGEVVLLIPSMPYKCPAAPYETAFLLDAALRRRKKRDKINITIHTFEPLPMSTAGPKAGKAIVELLKGRGIGFVPGVTIESVSADTREVLWSNGDRKKADLLITVPPHKAPDVVKVAGLTNEAGWIPVDSKTLKTKHKNIFAIGDVTTLKLEGKYKPDKPLMLPKAGVFAHHEAEVVAANIAAEITGKGGHSQFNGEGSCFLELGDGTAGFAAGDFFAVPHPVVEMRNPSRRAHIYKALLEKYWFWRWF